MKPAIGSCSGGDTAGVAATFQADVFQIRDGKVAEKLSYVKG